MKENHTAIQNLSDADCLWNGIDFWMLNDALDESQMSFELDQMRSQGVSTVIVRTYVGLKSDYPGAGFKEKFRIALEHADKIGMKFVVQAAYMPEAVPGLAPEHTAGCMVESSPGVYTFKQTPMYVDMLNPEAVRYYLENGYVKMWQEFSSYFGKTIISVWVDEPSYCREGIPWSSVFEQEYKTMWGTNPDPAPCFHDMPGCEEARFRYWNTIVRLLEKSYYQQMQECCRKLGLLASGHLMGEGNFHSNFARGAAMMPFYRYFDIPGIDCLTAEMLFKDSPLPRREGTPAVFQELYTTVFQCVSAAKQCGKKRILCEMYGVTSENFAIRNQNAMFNRFASLGINCRTVHAMFYSLRGRGKRAYPPHINYYQPYWQDYHLSIENAAFNSRFVSCGRDVTDTLVLLPWNTAATLFARGELGDNGVEKLRKLEQNFLRLQYDLVHNQIPFDLGDEFLLADLGGVDKNKIICGKSSYCNVVLPWCTKLADSTLALLKEFSKRGGRIFTLGEPHQLQDTPVENSAQLCKLLEKSRPVGFESDDRTSLQLLHRQCEDHERLFFCNCDCAAPHTVRLEKAARELLTDGSLSLPSREFEIQPGGALRLILDNKDVTTVKSAQTVMLLHLENSWQLQKNSPNAFVLEFARYRKQDSGNWSDLLPILAIHGILTEEKYRGKIALRFDIECDKNFSGCRLALENPEAYSVTCNGKAVFNHPDGFFCAREFECIPLPELFCGTNTIELKRDFSPLEKPVKGVTELYEHLKGVELEVPFFIGDFAVKTLREPTHTPGVIRLNSKMFLTSEPERVGTGLTEAGYPFFAGRVQLSQTFEVPEAVAPSSVTLKFGHFNAASARITLNNCDEGVVHSPPYSIPLKHLHKGKNLLTIELAGTLRNLLGPSHRPQGEYGECFGGYGFPNKNWTGEVDNQGRVFPRWYENRTSDTTSWCESFMQVPFGVADPVIEFEPLKSL